MFTKLISLVNYYKYNNNFKTYNNWNIIPEE